jgi:hypothetical protein
MYRQALEVLQWGRKEWKDVPTDDRGSMFELTYIRAVKRMYVTALIEVCHSIASLANHTSDIPLARLMMPTVNPTPSSTSKKQ